MLIMSIPGISPIELNMAPPGAKLLPAPNDAAESQVSETVDAAPEDPDYKVEQVEVPPPPLFIASPALMAINEIEQALEVNAHHDFGWWRTRINTVRDGLKPQRPINVSP